MSSICIVAITGATSENTKKNLVVKAAKEDNVKNFLYYSRFKGIEQEGLRVATQHNAIKIAKFFIDQGVNVNFQFQAGETVLMIASSNNAKEVAELLIKPGAVVNQVNNAGETVLMIASSNNAKEATELLIKSGASVNPSIFFNHSIK